MVAAVVVVVATAPAVGVSPPPHLHRRLLRRLRDAGEDAGDHEGPRFTLSGVRVQPKPVQQPIEVWLGGFAPSELSRCGRLGDGWIPSFTTPAVVAAGIASIQETAADCGREIDPGHFGALVPFVHRSLRLPWPVFSATGPGTRRKQTPRVAAAEP